MPSDLLGTYYFFNIIRKKKSWLWIFLGRSSRLRNVKELSKQWLAIKMDIKIKCTDTSKDSFAAEIQCSHIFSALFTIACKISSEPPIAPINWHQECRCKVRKIENFVGKREVQCLNSKELTCNKAKRILYISPQDVPVRQQKKTKIGEKWVKKKTT